MEKIWNHIVKVHESSKPDDKKIKGPDTDSSGENLESHIAKVHESKKSDDSAHWDFLLKFLSLHYHITLEGVLGV